MKKTGTSITMALVMAYACVVGSGGYLRARQNPAAPNDPKVAAKAPATAAKPESPRTLGGYVEQEKDFFAYLMKNHPMITVYEKQGRMVGKYHISDREEEFVEEGGGEAYAKTNHKAASITYRLPMESILDLPNKFVGPEKCAECHPAQYEKWSRSRHAKVVRFPDEMVEIPGMDLNKGSVWQPGLRAAARHHRRFGLRHHRHSPDQVWIPGSVAGPRHLPHRRGDPADGPAPWWPAATSTRRTGPNR